MKALGRPNSFTNVRPIGGKAPRTALSPVVKLNVLERSIFNLTVTRHKHLKPADVVLVTAFAQSAARVLSGRRPDRDTRTMVLLSRALRLAPMNALEPRTVARARRDAESNNPLAEYLAERAEQEPEDAETA
jgi:hypothetical protein